MKFEVCLRDFILFLFFITYFLNFYRVQTAVAPWIKFVRFEILFKVLPGNPHEMIHMVPDSVSLIDYYHAAMQPRTFALHAKGRCVYYFIIRIDLFLFYSIQFPFRTELTFVSFFYKSSYKLGM